ncbi:uncharacterized protein N0V89_003338 [Didymosphaeria variabile]|uniref:Cytochrome P450 n=1 Tax=Didymosphaeria variabile TaxID=1932322 RepID=A0A9W8XUE7_9PLEO|nr:uncharacterized protein N0V89_003338 [Didymosphaeria variabile]KAJ4358754.1 hypothetical protein N0V89_003338 [Didymosphaeria variabile]
MGVSSPTTLLVLFSIVAAYLLNRLVRSQKHDLPLPPGPKGLPLLGNVNDLPKPGMLECHHWLKHKELIGWNNTLAFSGYTDTFKLHRKNIAKVAGSTVSLSVFDRVQEEEAVHFLLNVLSSPENLFSHIKKEAGAVILKITYGYTAEAHGKDPLVDMAVKTMHEFADSTVPGKWAVDIMPFCEYMYLREQRMLMQAITDDSFCKIVQYAPDWFPGAGFKRTARQMAAQLHQTTEQPYQFVKQQMRQNKAKTSFLSQAIENIKGDSDTDDMESVHKWSASSMYLGGADTTVSSLMTFFLAITLFPDVQKKAQEELDRVIGNRLPVSADRQKLPYIEALVSETHRWHPVAPMALPHASTKDDVINGYRIPKGSLLLPNNWWFTHDPSVYHSPMEFNPDRYLKAEPEPDPRNWIFGYGRRVCPGRYVAENALFLTIAQSLAVFKIENPVDENGKVVKPEMKFEPGVVSHPVPYRVSIKPRSEKHELLIREAEKQYPWQESDAKALETVKW